MTTRNSPVKNLTAMAGQRQGVTVANLLPCRSLNHLETIKILRSGQVSLNLTPTRVRNPLAGISPRKSPLRGAAQATDQAGMLSKSLTASEKKIRQINKLAIIDLRINNRRL